MPKDDLDLKETIVDLEDREKSILGEKPTIVTTEKIEKDFDPSRYSDTSRYEFLEPEKPLGKGGFVKGSLNLLSQT